MWLYKSLETITVVHDPQQFEEVDTVISIGLAYDDCCIPSHLHNTDSKSDL